MWKLSDGTTISADGKVAGKDPMAAICRVVVKQLREGKHLTMAVERGVRRVRTCGDLAELLGKLGAKHNVRVEVGPEPKQALPRWPSLEPARKRGTKRLGAQTRKPATN